MAFNKRQTVSQSTQRPTRIVTEAEDAEDTCSSQVHCLVSCRCTGTLRRFVAHFVVCMSVRCSLRLLPAHLAAGISRLL